MAATIDAYVGAVVARWDVMRRPGQLQLDEPGVRGLLACTDDPVTRLLVTDDRAYDALAALLPDAEAGIVDVFAAAARCAKLLNGHAAWKSGDVTAMMCRDLQTVPPSRLPSELTLRPVRRLAGVAPDGVALEDAAAAAILADPRGPRSNAGLPRRDRRRPLDLSPSRIRDRRSRDAFLPRRLTPLRHAPPTLACTRTARIRARLIVAR